MFPVELWGEGRKARSAGGEQPGRKCSPWWDACLRSWLRWGMAEQFLRAVILYAQFDVISYSVL